MERQVVEYLGDQSKSSQPQRIFKNITRPGDALRRQKAKNGEGDPSDLTKKPVTCLAFHQHRRNMVDHHRYNRNNLQCMGR